MFSSTLTARETIKWIAIHILIGKTILTKSGMVENNKNSMKVEYSNVVILLFLDIVFIFIFNFTCLLLNVYNYIVITTDLSRMKKVDLTFFLFSFFIFILFLIYFLLF